MRLKYHCMATIITLALSGTALAACNKPQLPDIADGASASQAVMVESQKAVKQYLEEGERYLTCLQDQEKTAVAEAKAAGVEPESEEAAALKEKKIAINEAYNHVVDAMHDLGDRFNAEVKKYKAANK